MNRKFLIALIVVLSVCLLITLVGLAAPFTPYARDVYRLVGIGPTSMPVAVPPPTGAATAIPPPPATPLASVSNETADALQRAQIPPRDLYQIVPRLRKNLLLATPVPTPAPRTRRVGERDQFFVTESAATGKYRTITATLQIVTPRAYFWTEEGMQVDQAALQKSADFFDQTVYPTNHKYFGSEKSPGIDGDTHIHILNTRFADAAGYFSREDTYPRNLVPFSNQRHIIYMNVEAVKPGGDQYNGDLAHEFQHLIHAYEELHATGWIDEGMGDLAIKVNGFPVGGVLELFGRNPDTQLNTWTNEPQTSGAHYAASYLFFDYLSGRFGPDFIRDVIHAPREGIFGVQSVLDQRAGGTRFDELFADWAAANYLNDPTIENGKYAYSNEAFRISREPSLKQYPFTRTAKMHEYAANYFSLEPADGDVTLYFTGTTAVKLLPVDAHSRRWMWWSNRGDLSDMTLTRAFDLSRVNKATLQFWTWYDIEKNFDYAYVEVSTDGGKTWDLLPGKNTTTANPNGASYGPAFTGKSGVPDDKSTAPAQWIPEQVDLTAYAGKSILLRFEYITDDAYNAPSFAVDDISVPEINFVDDGESGSNGWRAEGFVRIDNVLPQRYIVQVVEKGNPARVVRIPLDDQNRGRLAIDGFGKNVSHAELIVTAFAPVTTEETQYQFAVVPK